MKMVLAALPQDTIRLIKSTQVITTPTSIVKELVENSIDASATTVSVKLEKYGFLRLEVRDNGIGICDKDVEFIAKPHFTSKIASFSDLSSLTSYGFRGEALSSLCAVSDVTITTKTKESPMGHSYSFNHHGEVISKKPAATPNGTTVIVCNLFKNIPVRHQYYSNSKLCKDELKKLEDLLMGLALAVPNVHLTLTHDKITIFQKNSAQDIGSVLMNILPDVWKSLTSKIKNVNDVSLKVFLPAERCPFNSLYSRTSSDRFFVLINKRPVKHKTVEKMVKAYFSKDAQGCHGRYPVGLVSLDVPPDTLDINLEPNKTRVLLKEEIVVLDALKDILEDVYGPLEKKKNDCGNTKDLLQGDTCADITCTFAGVSQQKINCPATISHVGDIPLNLGKESTTINDFDDVSKKNPFQKSVISSEESKDRALKHRQKEIIQDLNVVSENATIHMSSGVFKGRNPEELTEENPAPLAAVTSGIGIEHKGIYKESFPVEKFEKNYCQGLSIASENSDKTKARMVSTPDDMQSTSLPDLSLSTVLSSIDSDSVIIKGKENNCNRGCENENLSSVLNSDPRSTKQKGDENVESEVGNTTLKNNSQLHESFVGSDGIPVFKIAPLRQSCVQGNSNVLECDTILGKENLHKLSLSSISNISEGNRSETQVHHQHQSQAHSDNSGDVLKKDREWCRGETVENGQNIQTIHLLKNNNICSNNNNLNKISTKRQLSLSSTENQENISIKNKKVKLNTIGQASFEYVHSTAVKRPSSAFILYSRDIRLQVLSQHPGKDFAWVAKEMADRWKNLDSVTKKHYQDMAKEDSNRYQREIKKIKEQRGLNASLNTTPVRTVGNRASLDKFVAPLTPQLIKREGKIVQQQPVVSKHPWKEHCKIYNIQLDMIRDKIIKKATSATQDSDITLIGPLNSCGGWTCLTEGAISTLSITRLHETILCRKLFQSFRLPASDLQDPIPFNESVVGSNNWRLLLQLKCEIVVGQNKYVVTDRRLTMNGFKITLYPSSESCAVLSHGEISGLCNSVGFYGINDLKEILSVLVVNHEATVSQIRPLKVQFWLKGEAVRMIRASPNMLSAEEVKELLNTWKEIRTSLDGSCKMTWEEGKCLHGKSIFTKLYSLDDLPLSQSQTQL
ncbi:ATP-binding mismatch repair protein [Halocaridina rubra]|uniref:ATP-binding mismatch repair protein n=1 Tax=Halocaridina rubra TaxID=373956 RepID=A0AAN8WDW3_HALRR